jgi:Predicted membrane protein
MPFSPLLPVHISAGMVGILSGAAAMTFRKGSPRHVLSGRVFVAAMLTMSASGAIIAAIKHQAPNVLAGTLAFYMVATAWATARRGDGKTGLFDWGALLFALAVAAVELAFAFQAVTSLTGQKDGYPAGLYFFFASILLLAAAGDIRMLARGGVFGPKRIVRHLWRMCFSLFIATGSFFLGQQQVFPAPVRKANVLFVPAFLPLFMLIFWRFRVWFTLAYRKSRSQLIRELHLARRTP